MTTPLPPIPTDDLRAATLALIALAADKPTDAATLLGPCAPDTLTRIARLGDALAQCALALAWEHAGQPYGPLDDEQAALDAPGPVDTVTGQIVAFDDPWSPEWPRQTPGR